MLLPQSIDPPVIGVAWTLHHELLFYLLAGLFLAWPRVVLSAATVLLLFSVFGVAGFPWDFLTSPLNWEFVMGVAASFLVPRIPGRMAPRLAVVAALALLCLVLTVPGNLNDGLERVRVWVFAPLFALLIASSARWEMGAGPPASLPSRVLAKLGASSYTLYLWHVSLVTPFTKICFAVFPLASDPVVLLFTLGIALLAVGMAHMIYLHVEQPLVRSLVRRLTQGPQSSAA